MYVPLLTLIKNNNVKLCYANLHLTKKENDNGNIVTVDQHYNTAYFGAELPFYRTLSSVHFVAPASEDDRREMGKKT